MTKKKRMGRPPAQWAFELESLRHKDTKLLTIADLIELTGAPAASLKAFFKKAGTPKEYELEGGQARALYRVRDIKKSARDHIEPWL